MDILREDVKGLNNYILGLLTAKRIELALISWSSCDFFECHSLLNLCFQNGHLVSSA